MDRPDWLTCYDEQMPSVLREVIEDLKWPHHERPLSALLQWYELMERSSTQPKIEVIPGIEGFALVNPTALDSVRPPVATFGHSPSTPPRDGPAPAGTPAVPE